MYCYKEGYYSSVCVCVCVHVCVFADYYSSFIFVYSQEIAVCCAVLDKLLQGLEAQSLLPQFSEDLVQGLSHPVECVRLLCLHQVNLTNIVITKFVHKHRLMHS